MFYSRVKTIKAHQDRSVPYYNHSYDREVRDALCSNCGVVIGEQVKYPDFDKDFHFDSKEKDSFSFCPHCGHKFNFNKTEK